MADDSGRRHPSRPGVQYINEGEDDVMEITGYRRSTVRTVLIWICIVLSVGLVRLFFYWLPHLMVRATHTVCSLAHAQTVILKDQYEQYFVSRVNTEDKPADGQDEGIFTNIPLTDNSTELIRYFITKKVKYLWREDFSQFIKVRGIEDGVSCAYFHQQRGQTYEQAADRRTLYGVNNISVHVTPIIRLLFKEALSPFYIFQVFSCILWFEEEYQYFASCIILMSCISITVTIYQTRKMQRALRNTIHSSTTVTVCRGGEVYHDVPSEDLVPGDVIEVPRHGCIMQCDAVLVTGNCIVNESMLTGESVPVTKTPLPNPKMTHEDSGIPFNLKDHSRHVLFCGTHVIQTRYFGGQKVLAVVSRTGFSTAKGELVRSILHPKPVDFKFNKDTYKFIGILACIALMGFIYTIVLMVNRDETVSDIVVRSLDLVTIAVPPALPAALTVGIVFAQSRMKAKNVYCISPRSINVCGSINTVCFDKTGTLTEDGLDMQGVVPVQNRRFREEVRNVRLLGNSLFMVGMATCHSLTIIDGVLSGDPLELIMFESIAWELTEPGDEVTRFDVPCPTIVHPKYVSESKFGHGGSDKINSEEYGIVRQFTFSSSLQRMSVIVRGLGADHYKMFTKGAPEMIASLCVPDTVPDDFHTVLMNYTKHGYRVLAMAYKPLPVKLKYAKLQRVQREQVERGLTFLGLIVMENRLKPETTPVIHQLQAANVRSIMVTGDNMLTALSVARECGMVRAQEPIILVQAYPPATDSYGNASAAPYIEYIYTEKMEDTQASGKQMYDGSMNLDIELGRANFYHFAVTGKSWLALRKYFPDLIDKIVTRGTIFARMSPDQKAQLVEALQDIGYYVGMCGDGANDCGALKTAHAGISLSEAEASVASPFTSKTPNISCIPTVIKEGRCALVTSFGIFKFMACYSLTQFTSVLILYWVGINVTDFEFLYIDLGLLTTLSLTFGRTGPHEELHKEPPLVSLMTLAPILSMTLQTIIVIGVQIFFYLFIMMAPWFVPFVEDPEDTKFYTSYENTSVFYASTYQYIILAIVFSKGKPYRKSIYTNVWFLANLVLCFIITVWINIYPTEGVIKFFKLQPPPSFSFRLLYIGGAVANFFMAIFVEMFVIDSRFMTVTLQKKFDNCFKSSALRHEEVEHELSTNKAWPPVKREDLAGTFKRLDSAYQSSSDAKAADLDDISLSSADSESLQAYGGTINPSDDIPHQSRCSGGKYNPGFTMEDEESTRL